MNMAGNTMVSYAISLDAQLPSVKDRAFADLAQLNLRLWNAVAV